MKHNTRNANFELINKQILAIGSTTYRVIPLLSETYLQIRIPGIKVMNTVDPENIKAILATQFNDFGKGQDFNGHRKLVLKFGNLTNEVPWRWDI